MTALRATITMTVARRDATRLLNGLRPVFTLAAQSPGFLRQRITRAVSADPDVRTFVVTSDWADEGCFHAFERSRTQDAATAALRAVRTSNDMQLSTVDVPARTGQVIA
ncbi:antibiotic biosynthesis monooxygenase [Nocardia sp. 2YAB30]|uniref:antibiotic biosynthesis monooxygenase family protein n=1 Tax=unclassified Nocardia TaxID=2637762 RepID=UPI003F9A1A4D